MISGDSKRKRFKGIYSGITLDVIRKYGRFESLKGGESKLFFGEREYRKAVKDIKMSIPLVKEHEEDYAGARRIASCLNPVT